MTTVDDIQKTLATILETDTKTDIVSLNMVKKIHAEDGDVTVVVELPSTVYLPKDDLEKRIKEAVKKLPGVRDASVLFTAKIPTERVAATPVPLPGVKNVIAVYACKGGVGKSTIATNLATALALQGHQVGLLDADVHGPNIPLMMGIDEQPKVLDDNTILPLMGHKVKVMSLGVLKDVTIPLIWRGPMVHGAVKQLLQDTHWGDLDFLIVDLPPGTGDAQLTIIQTVRLAGVVIVSTPQTVSLLDGVKGIKMFRQLNVPILGIVENMSGFTCPHCQKDVNIFSKGGGEDQARKHSLPFLGAVPLDPNIVVGGDSGKPIVVSHPTSPSAKALFKMTERVQANIPLARQHVEGPQAVPS